MVALNVNALPTSSTTCLKFKVGLGVSLHKSINSLLQNRVKGPPGACVIKQITAVIYLDATVKP